MSSGLLVGGVHPLTFARRLEDLSALIAGVGEPCWAYGPTAAALLGVDGWPLLPPYELLTLRGRHVTRIGHVIHTTLTLPLVDRAEAFGLPVTSGTRTLIDLARTRSSATLTAAVDSATGLGITSDDYLHRRLVALRGKGQAGIGRLLQVLAGIEVTWSRIRTRCWPPSGPHSRSTTRHFVRAHEGHVRFVCAHESWG